MIDFCVISGMILISLLSIFAATWASSVQHFSSYEDPKHFRVAMTAALMYLILFTIGSRLIIYIILDSME